MHKKVVAYLTTDSNRLQIIVYEDNTAILRTVKSSDTYTNYIEKFDMVVDLFNKAQQEVQQQQEKGRNGQI